jgi:hypothetical protein
MVGCVPGLPPPDRGPPLPRGSRGPVVPRRRQLRGHLPLPSVVVRRVAGGVRRRQAAHRQEPARLYEQPARGPVLAGSTRKSLRKVSVKILYEILLLEVCVVTHKLRKKESWTI